MSILPPENSPWPPKAEAQRYERMRVNSAWYAGDPVQLAGLNMGVQVSQSAGGPPTTVNPYGTQSVQTLSGRDAFWGTRNNPEEVDTRRHLPVAQDIATSSADMLFSTMPSIKVDGPMQEEATEDGEAKALRPTAETRAAQQRIEHILDRCHFHQTLVAAAETSAALGSTALRIAVDRRVAKDRAMIARVDADAVIPRYSWGALIGVIFWQTVQRSETDIWRHLEAHEAGMIYHGLYRGDGSNLGKRMPLDAHPATRHLVPEVNADDAVELDREGGHTAVSIPNMLPDSVDRQNNAGRSDYTPAVRGLFDDIDRTYTQLMESIDDARSRLFIDRSLLESDGPGTGLSFNQDQRLFHKVNQPPAETETSRLPIEKIQFDMRVTEYLEAIDGLTKKAIEFAGYTADTDRDDRGAAMTATEYQGREQRTMKTRGRKMGYFQSELEEILTTLLRVDVEQFSPIEMVDGVPTAVKAMPITVEFPRAVQPTLLDLANTAKALREAEAASKETLVRTVHPEWDEMQVHEEVTAILAEGSAIDPVTFGTSGARVDAADSMLKQVQAIDKQFDAWGKGVRNGADAAAAAERVGLAGLKLSGGVPTSLRPAREDATGLEQE